MFKSIALCRDRIQLQGPVVLGIHSNVKGDGMDYTSGHAWITVDTPEQTLYLGLWPDGHPRVVENRPGCTDVQIGLERGSGAVVSRFYALNAIQVISLNHFINRPDVWGYLNTCAAWATKLLREVLGVNIDSIDYLFFSTPRELGKTLERLEQKYPSSRLLPRVGEVAQPSFGR